MMRWIVRYLLLIWLLVLIVLNVVPLSNDTNQTLMGKKVLQFRLDYLIHFTMMLSFAWIWVLQRIQKVRWFKRNEAVKFSLFVLATGVGLELWQLLIPWRSYNPVDLWANVGGAVLAIVVVWIS